MKSTNRGGAVRRGLRLNLGVRDAPDGRLAPEVTWSKNVRRRTMAKENRISRISLMGGLIGALATNPRAALQAELDKQNQQGWNAIHIDPHGTTNLFVRILQLVVLILTLGLFTWGGGYLVLFEKEG